MCTRFPPLKYRSCSLCVVSAPTTKMNYTILHFIWYTMYIYCYRGGRRVGRLLCAGRRTCEPCGRHHGAGQRYGIPIHALYYRPYIPVYCTVVRIYLYSSSSFIYAVFELYCSSLHYNIEHSDVAEHALYNIC